MNIGEASKLSGLPAKTIRYYESIGLVESPTRNVNGYQTYTTSNIAVFQFLQHACEVGFSLKECKQLLRLYRDPARHSAEVKALVVEKVAEIDRKINQFNKMKQSLNNLASQCKGDEHPTCAIIDGLAGSPIETNK